MMTTTHKIIVFILTVKTCVVYTLGEPSSPCSSFPCLYEGECEDMPNERDFRCKCGANRHGRHCELETIESRCGSTERRASDGRLVKICLNGGTCFRTNLEPKVDKCSCPSGYFGKQCELSSKIKIHNPEKPPKFHFMDDYCNSTFQGRCKNNGTCVNYGEFDYRCICARGWAGEDCTFRTMYEPEQLKPHPRNIDLRVGILGRGAVSRTEPIRGRAIENSTSADEDFCQTLWSNSCQNGGVCVTGIKNDFECECPLEWSGKTCLLPMVTNACSSQPCLHGGLCILMSDDSFTCDCPREFLGKFCAEMNPCIKGSVYCKFGSTCVRKNDDDFECLCRMPYTGEHCDEENLCLIDEGECVDDLLPKAKCFPCKVDESCLKIRSDKYECDYVSTSSPNPNQTLAEMPRRGDHEETYVTTDNVEDGRNMLMPGIVLLTLFLYLLILVIILIVDHFNRIRPRLIIVGDIRRIGVDSFYLLTVETGNDMFAGTAAKIYCEIFGDKNKTNVLILNNYLINGMRQNDDIDFLINTPNPLGNILMIQLWLNDDDQSNVGFRPSWYCRKVIVRDIKTEEMWFFFVKKWLCFDVGEFNAVEARVATPVEVENAYGMKFRWGDVIHQLREHHMWINTFTCPSKSVYSRAERLTASTALLCCYMFLTMVFYGVSDDSVHHRIKEHHQVTFENYSPIFAIGTEASLLGVVFGWFLAIIFRIIRRQLIPALIVWDDTVQDVQRKSATMQTDSIHFPKERRFDEVDVVRPTLFRIPSTDIIQTEKWISRLHVNTRRVLKNISQGKPYQDRYVHNYVITNSGNSTSCQKVRHRVPCCRKYGTRCVSVGHGVQKSRCRGISQREYLSVARLSFLTEALADAVSEPSLQDQNASEICQIGTKFMNKNPNSKHRVTFAERKLESNNSTSKTSLTTPDTFDGIGDAVLISTKEFTKSQERLSRNSSTSTSTVGVTSVDTERPWKLELCSIEHSIHPHHCLPYTFVWVARGITVSMILVFSVFIAYYGCRFSWHKSMNWLLSTCWALLESFFLFQPLKVLFTYILFIYKQWLHPDLNPLKLDIKLRFKLLWVSGAALPIVIWPLYYLIHPLRFNGEYQTDPANCIFPLHLKPVILQSSQTEVRGAPLITRTENNTVVALPQEAQEVSNDLLKPSQQFPLKKNYGRQWLHSTRRRVSNQIQKLKTVRSPTSQSHQKPHI